MASDASKQLVMLINKILTPEGYKKKASEWRKESSECIPYLWLQRSLYSDTFYINMRSVIKSIAPQDVSKHYASVQCRFMEFYFPDKVELLDFNANELMVNTEKINRFGAILASKGLELMKMMETIEGIRVLTQTEPLVWWLDRISQDSGLFPEYEMVLAKAREKALSVSDQNSHSSHSANAPTGKGL